MIQFLFNNIKLCLGSKILGNFLFLSLFLCIIFIAEKKKKKTYFLLSFAWTRQQKWGPMVCWLLPYLYPKGRRWAPAPCPSFAQQPACPWSSQAGPQHYSGVLRWPLVYYPWIKHESSGSPGRGSAPSETGHQPGDWRAKACYLPSRHAVEVAKLPR